MEKKKEPLAVANLAKVCLAAGLAYLEYAFGGLLLMALMNARASATGPSLFEIKAADSALKTQFMLLLFFINKPAAIIWVAGKWQANRVTLWSMLLFFWFVDASGLWLYQMIVFRAATIPMVIWLGFFSAIIIVTSIQRNYRKSAKVG